jgi:[ribosomal protein S5]-alanine N-acetyltransferase
MIRTVRLILRDLQRADAEALYAYMRDDAYWRHLPIDPPTREDVEALVERCVREQEAQPRGSFFLTATLRDTREVVGEAILHIRSALHRQGEIGWAVAADHQRQGLATEIGWGLLRFGFENLGLHRIFARCRDANVGSRRVMAKIGMVEEGLLCENVLARGEWWSSVQCSILAQEYRPLQRQLS